MKKKLFLLAVVAASLTNTGCKSWHDAYSKTGWWTPDSVNYTFSRSRLTGEDTDYFGATWQLKDTGK